jgi:hypothetical protein
MAVQALFKTAYLQRMILVDALLAAPVNVGDLVTYNPTTRAIAPATDPTVANACIIAQSDTSLAVLDGARSGPYKHVRIQDKVWQFDRVVAATTGTITKKVSIFRVTNPLDVVVYDEATITGAPEQLR